MKKLLSLSLLLSMVGCAEVRDRSDAAPADGGAPTPDVPADRDAPVLTDVPVTANPVVINEINSAAPDWVELLNAGGTPIDLSALSILDGDDTHTAVPFPAGTVLAPGQRYIVAFDSLCADPAPMGLDLTERCLETTYGIGGSGDTIRIRDASDAVVVSVEFPGEAAAGIEAGQTYCRLPDGSGAFAACAATLGAPNTAP